MYLGLDQKREFVNVRVADLVTHAVVLGRTGSGKTGLIAVLVEEAVTESDAGVIVFDVKGDLANLVNCPTSDDEATSFGMQPTNHWNAVRSFGYDYKHAKHLRESTDFEVVNPDDIDFVPSFDVPKIISERIAADRVAIALRLVRGTDTVDVADVAMTRAVLAYWQRGMSFPLREWPHYLTAGVFDDDFHANMFPKRARVALSKGIVCFLHKHGDRSNKQLDVEKIIGARRVVVLRLAHLTEEARQSVVSSVLLKVVDSMRTASQSDKPRLILVLDEARGFLPPAPFSPSSKPPLALLLAQGRSAGISVILGTQSPMDLDYKALGNIGTWFVGKLRERDCARDLLAELRRRDIDFSLIEDQSQRGFLLLTKDGEHVQLSVRHALSALDAKV